MDCNLKFKYLQYLIEISQKRKFKDLNPWISLESADFNEIHSHLSDLKRAERPLA